VLGDVVLEVGGVFETAASSAPTAPSEVERGEVADGSGATDVWVGERIVVWPDSEVVKTGVSSWVLEGSEGAAMAAKAAEVVAAAGVDRVGSSAATWPPLGAPSTPGETRGS